MAQAQLARVDVSNLDVGDSVRLRSGEIHEVEEVDPGTEAPIKVDGCWYCSYGVVNIDNPNLENDDDIVAVLETPGNVPVSIEGLKVGSKVRLHNDAVLTLHSIDNPHSQYRYVFRTPSGSLETYTPEGFFSLIYRTSNFNVAEILSRATDVVRLDDVKVGDRLRLRDNQIRKVSTIYKHPDGKRVPYAEGFSYDLSGKINFMAERPNEDHHADVLEILPPESVDLSKFDLKPGIRAVTRDGRLLAYKGVYGNNRRLTEWRGENPSENRLYWPDGQRYARETKDDILEVLAPLNPNANV